ncbi:MAG TPA: 30S ribosomal protein S13 [Candidatus Krumholzibacteria bacterium]|nr:30S ribosomal protein S13 [Candidatus Krumholzibacteria bacterium]
MARIAGVDIPNEKRIATSLTYIFGIGDTRAFEICEKCGIDPQTTTSSLTEDQARLIRNIIEKDYQVEGALRSEVSMNLQRLKDIGCYRGLRHRRGLPVRGQNTKNNARTRKGPKGRPGAKKK